MCMDVRFSLYMYVVRMYVNMYGPMKLYMCQVLFATVYYASNMSIVKADKEIL